MRMREWRRAGKLLATFGLLSVAAYLSAQTQAPNDANQIGSLVSGLCDHSRAVADALDPNLSSSDRAKNLSRFSDPHFELTLQTEGPTAITGGSASLPVWVHFKTEHFGLETSATLHFVKRNDTWYFANFDFLSIPTVLLLVGAVFIHLSVGYAGTVLTLWWKLSRQDQLSLADSKVLIPFFWPSLFRRIS